MSTRSTMEDEFREFVAARSAALLRTAYLLAGDWATAEDLLQTALTKTYLAWKRLGEIEAVEPYTRRVLVNTATSWWRRRWHGERPTEVLPERAAPDRLDEHLERDALWRHVKALPARQRAVLVLRFYEDQSEAQTAALLGISVGTVKSQTSRALGTLRQRLAAEGVESALPGISRTATPAAASSPAAVPTPAVVPAPAGPPLAEALATTVELPVVKMLPEEAPATDFVTADALPSDHGPDDPLPAASAGTVATAVPTRIPAQRANGSSPSPACQVPGAEGR